LGGAKRETRRLQRRRRRRRMEATLALVALAAVGPAPAPAVLRRASDPPQVIGKSCAASWSRALTLGTAEPACSPVAGRMEGTREGSDRNHGCQMSRCQAKEHT
jgi:hypothetical protein